MIRAAILGGVRIPFHAGYDMDQRYEPIARESVHAMGDGSYRKQIYGGTQGLVRTTIRGNGAIPPGLEALDFSTALELKCAAERAIVSASNAITIPSARRSDTGYTPWGRALVGSRWEVTPVAMATDLATLTQVAGASQYQVLWWPQFYVLVEGGGVSESHDIHNSETGWELSMLQLPASA